MLQNFIQMPDGRVVPNPLALKPDSIVNGYAEAATLPPDVRDLWQGEGRAYYTRYQFLDGQVQIHFNAEASEALAKLNCPQVLNEALRQSVSNHSLVVDAASSQRLEPARCSSHF